MNRFGRYTYATLKRTKNSKETVFTLQNTTSLRSYRKISGSRYIIIYANRVNIKFHRVANIYFLLVAALQLIPTLSPTGQYTTILPLICVMGLSMLKDTIEDLVFMQQTY